MGAQQQPLAGLVRPGANGFLTVFADGSARLIARTIAAPNLHGLFTANEVYVPANPDALSLIGFTLLIEKLLRFQQTSASFRTAAMGPAAQVYGIVFNSIKTNTDIEVPKMRMQLRLNQFKAQKRAVAPTAKIFDTQIRDAMIVRRAVTLGLPVFLVGTEGAEADSVANDYRRLVSEMIEHAPNR